MSARCPHEAARPATPADRADIAALRDEARVGTLASRGGAAFWGRDRPADQTDRVLAAALDGADHAVALVGTLDGMTVGYLLAEWRDTPGTGRVTTVLELWVTPEARGIGVGESMIEAALGWARDSGSTEIDASALPGDRATKNFFESQGLVARSIAVSTRLD